MGQLFGIILIANIQLLQSEKMRRKISKSGCWLLNKPLCDSFHFPEREFFFNQRRLWGTGSLGRVFANGPGYLGSIPGRVIPKTKNGTWYLLA